MAGNPSIKKKCRTRAGLHQRQISIGSGLSGQQMNPIFFDKSNAHTSSTTWKSPAVIDRDEYNRIRQRVKHIAPEQFRDPAKPGSGPCEIFPQNMTAWKEHQIGMMAMKEAEKLQEINLMKDLIEAKRKIPIAQRKIVSTFGGETGKVFKDGRGPVLAQQTIWSAEHDAFGNSAANWPTKQELVWNGDSRESHMPLTRCGRFLPPPRAPVELTNTIREQPMVRPAPLDQTGPVYDFGPMPADVVEANYEMDTDASHEVHGQHLLGDALYKEIGKQTEVYVPDWQRAGRLEQLDWQTGGGAYLAALFGM